MKQMNPMVPRDIKVQYFVDRWEKLKLDNYPWEHADPLAVDHKIKAIIQDMKDVGVISPTTYWMDVKIKSLIEEARVIRDGKKETA